MRSGAIRFTNRIDPKLTIEIYHFFLRDPLKSFVKRDFSKNGSLVAAKSITTHLFLLEKLNVIEKVKLRYSCGKKLGSRRDILAWRLK